MSFADVPLVLMLAGLAAYAVLGGADFGVGIWQLTAGRRRDEVREFTHEAIAPVWEANHVWLIFVLVVCWTGYPTAFGSIASTLSVPLFIAALGIILRGMAYALRLQSGREQRAADDVFALSSILTPFALGAAIGGIASGRVPVGNAQGSLVTSWLNPTSILIGVLAVTVGAYLAAVFLAGDAAKAGRDDLARAFRARALVAGVLAGAVAFAGLGVLSSDAPRLWDGLTSGAGLACVLVSAAAGIATLLLVGRGLFQPARFVAALAVAAIVAGWGAAQNPVFLPGLTVEQAAAGRTTLIALILGIAAGAVVLVPSLALLFTLVLRGRFGPRARREPGRVDVLRRRAIALPLEWLAIGFLAAGVGLTMFAGAAWALAIGVVCLFAFVATGFLAIAGPGSASPP